MIKSFYELVLGCFLLFGGVGNLHAQFIDFNSENPYKKVFVKSDNFGFSYLDQLQEAFPKATPDSLKFSMLNDLAYYWHTRNLVKAMKFTQKGLKLTRSKGDCLWEGRFQITEGAILLRMEKLDSAEYVLEIAKMKVLATDLPHLITQLGYVYERRGQLDKAADYAFEALHIGENLKDNRAIAMAYSDLSNLFWKQSKFDIGLDYGLKSVALFEERGIKDLDYDFTLYLVGNNYLALKEHRKALKYFEDAVKIGEQYGFFNNLSDVYISLIDLYAYLGEFKKAERAAKNALKFAELLTNSFMEMRSWLSIGKLYNIEGKYKLAINSLNACIRIATEDFGDDFYLSVAYKALGKAYAESSQYEKAYQAFKKYDTYKSEVFTAESNHRIARLHEELEVAKKESTIVLQKGQIKRQQARQIGVIIITILLFLLLLLSYLFLKKNIKINDLLRKQNDEKAFLLKEIHHRVKNNLEMISSLLALQSSQIKDSNVLNAIEASQHRVHSMGMIHQKLYAGDSFRCIEMENYFVHLADYIIDVFGMQKQVTIAVNMDSLELDVDTAISIGLIVNELLTNALKYAFPNQRKGKINIILREVNNVLELGVSDNGIGNKSNAEAVGTGFGTKLIELLTKQLNGKIVMSTIQGTAVNIKFNFNRAA